MISLQKVLIGWRSVGVNPKNMSLLPEDNSNLNKKLCERFLVLPSLRENSANNLPYHFQSRW